MDEEAQGPRKELGEEIMPVVAINAPFPNRIVLQCDPLEGPFVTADAKTFDPRRDMSLWLEGDLLTIASFSFDALNNRYLMYTPQVLLSGNAALDATLILQAAFHAPTSPFLGTFATVTTIAVTPNPIILGGTVTLTATVANAAQPATTPTGTVQFFDGVTPLGGTHALVGGTVSITTSALTTGTHFLYVQYAPDQAVFNASASEIVAEAIVVYTTDTVLVVMPNPALSSESITLTATITAVSPLHPTPGFPPGTIQFYDNVTPLGSPVTAVSGIAVYTPPLSPGFGPFDKVLASQDIVSPQTAGPLTPVNPSGWAILVDQYNTQSRALPSGWSAMYTDPSSQGLVAVLPLTSTAPVSVSNAIPNNLWTTNLIIFGGQSLSFDSSDFIRRGERVKHPDCGDRPPIFRNRHAGDVLKYERRCQLLE